MKNILFISIALLIGCSNNSSTVTDAGKNKVSDVKEQSIDEMFSSYQSDVVRQCYKLDLHDCEGYARMCVSNLRRGQGKFSCGNGINPLWDPFHASHIAEEKILNCLGKGEYLGTCKKQFANIHQATPTQVFDACMKNSSKSSCTNDEWKSITKVSNEKLCDLCGDKCTTSNNYAACLVACDKNTPGCKEIPAFKSEQECLKEMVEKTCHNLFERCSNVRYQSNDECLTKE